MGAALLVHEATQCLRMAALRVPCILAICVVRAAPHPMRHGS